MSLKKLVYLVVCTAVFGEEKTPTPPTILGVQDVANRSHPWVLVFDGQPLEEIEPGAFSNATHLKYVNVTNSPSLKEIKEGVFNGTNIITLNLKNNGISTIATKAFDRMAQLEEINLENNKLTQWNSRWFDSTPQLRKIDFASNQISVLPQGAFANVAKADIDLTSNNINLLGGRLFRVRSKISSLRLADNDIKTLKQEVWGTKVTLHYLDLSFNKIQCVSGDLTEVLIPQEVNLGGNPFGCDCYRRVERWAQSSPKNIIWGDVEENCGL